LSYGELSQTTEGKRHREARVVGEFNLIEFSYDFSGAFLHNRYDININIFLEEEENESKFQIQNDAGCFDVGNQAFNMGNVS
jgi:hypothetical protein